MQVHGLQIKKSKTVTHIQQVKGVLSTLLEHQLYVKGDKFEFHVHKVAWLEYSIWPEGVLIDQDNIEAVRNGSQLQP